MFNKITSYFILKRFLYATLARCCVPPKRKRFSASYNKRLHCQRSVFKRLSEIKMRPKKRSAVTHEAIKKSLFLTAIFLFMCFIPNMVHACTNPVGVAGDMVYNDSEHIMQWCDGTNWIGAGQAPYIPNGVEFDGVNDYLSAPGSLSDVGDTKQVTISFWALIKEGADYVFDSDGIEIQHNANTNDSLITMYNDANTVIFLRRGVNNLSPIEDQWAHFIFSVDLENGLFEYYQNDSTANMTGGTPVTIDDFINADSTNNVVVACGNNGVGVPACVNGDTLEIADLWIDYGTYLDLSDVNIRRQFIDANGFPVDLGSDGSKPTGSVPDIFLSGDTATWHTNDGTAGGFTETGAITDTITNPGENLGPTGGLVGWWKLDETAGTTAVDSSVSGNDATYIGTLPANNSVSGVIGTGIDIFSPSAYTVIETTNQSLYRNMDEMTFSMWARLVDDTENGGLLSLGSSTTDFHTSLLNNFNSEDLNFAARAWSTTDGSWRTNTEPLTVGQWHHVAITYSYNDAPGTDPVFYVDGVALGSITEITTPAGSFATPASDIPVLIGRRDNSSSGEWKGDLDDVRLYDRVLSASEIADLYNTGRVCQNPDGFRGGDTMYNTSEHVPQYCNLREWMPMDVQGGDGGSCTTAGDLCSDGSYYAGLSPDGNAPMFFTSIANESASRTWNNGSAPTVSTGVNDTDDGDGNTAILVGLSDADSPYNAANYCNDLVAHGSSNWYLPAENELLLIYNSGSPLGDIVSGPLYWTSSETTSSPTAQARSKNMSVAFTSNTNKTGTNRVRCVRKGGVTGECSNPTGDEGDIVYNTTHSVLQYCEGDEWIAIGEFN